MRRVVDTHTEHSEEPNIKQQQKQQTFFFRRLSFDEKNYIYIQINKLNVTKDGNDSDENDWELKAPIDNRRQMFRLLQFHSLLNTRKENIRKEQYNANCFYSMNDPIIIIIITVDITLTIHTHTDTNFPELFDKRMSSSSSTCII